MVGSGIGIFTPFRDIFSDFAELMSNFNAVMIDPMANDKAQEFSVTWEILYECRYFFIVSEVKRMLNRIENNSFRSNQTSVQTRISITSNETCRLWFVIAKGKSWSNTLVIIKRQLVVLLRPLQNYVKFSFNDGSMQLSKYLNYIKYLTSLNVNFRYIELRNQMAIFLIEKN
ncbi:hypothetical protein BpHYR1_050749 [Brachionus plicatilis]|uniref:Uncharacterized protein n=1 Tax=Brachionus plicatilis TaxID=10195 RepID=A0A3M7Q133_BRAPC|nr:hypothetical protein BpHYR1_050749 [Brachionus plicatilis]